MTIKNNALAVIDDVQGVNPVTFEVNFDEKHPHCLRVTMGDKESIIEYPKVFAMMFTLASKEQQMKMMPVREDLGTQYMKQVSIRCKNDMKAGDLLTVNIPINVPQLIVDAAQKELDVVQSDI